MPTNSKKSKRIWTHNSYLGCVAMANRNMLRIALAETTTPAAKQIADEISALLERLKIELKTRID